MAESLDTPGQDDVYICRAGMGTPLLKVWGGGLRSGMGSRTRRSSESKCQGWNVFFPRNDPTKSPLVRKDFQMGAGDVAGLRGESLFRASHLRVFDNHQPQSVGLPLHMYTAHKPSH